ncbi:MAG: zinc-binding dehydrogenase [Phycisphaerae bacterium]|nr:zinc-binding dehydrogenase [Phycisphaerae bacterium]
MKAVRFHQTGKPDVLKLETLPDPVPEHGELVIRVRAAAMNRMDVFLRSGSSSMPGFSMPHTGGFDVAGDVAAVGPDGDKSLVGRAVMVKARVTGPAATGKLDIIGITRPGGFAEFVRVPANAILPKPAHYSYDEAAAYPCVYITAVYGLVYAARLKPGETVLVHGGSSGAGMAAAQVAKVAGARVITTVGSPEKVEMAKSLLGADLVLNHRTDDPVAKIRDFTSGRGVDVVFDPVWGSSVARTIECLNWRARWIVLGMVGGLTAEVNVLKIMFREVTVRGIVEFLASEDQINATLALAHQNRVRPIIDRVWPLEQLADAHRQMEAGQFFGKIVVRP